MSAIDAHIRVNYAFFLAASVAPGVWTAAKKVNRGNLSRVITVRHNARADELP
jgi:hypothetical protein